MSPAPHRIHRQSWRVRAPDQPAAFALRALLRQRLEGEVLPVFQRVFDAQGTEGLQVRIPRLELRLRARDGEDLARRLPELIEQGLRQALAETLPPERAPAPAPGGRSPPAEARRRALLFYLRHGRLEWPEAGLEAGAALALLRQAARAWAAELLRDPAAPCPALAGPGIPPGAGAARFLRLLPAPRGSALLAALPLSGIPLSRVLRELARWPRVGEELRLGLQALALDLWARGAARTDDPEVAAAVAPLVAACAALLPPEADAGTGAAPGMDTATLDWLRACRFPAAAGARAAPGTAPGPTGGAAAVASGPAGGAAMPAPAPGPHARSAPRPVRAGAAPWPQLQPAAAEAAPDAQAGLPVAQAGLVLLHPYLPRLLAATGLARDDTPRLDPDHLPRAATLLHWLATGRQDPHEFELAWIKVLLGAAPDTPLGLAAASLDAAHLAEGEALLGAAIGHWSALRHTSVEGLRQTFLQRPGLLGQEESAWRLRIEPRPYDMLLNHLPWGISLVKLPWMARPVLCEWPTP